MDKKYILQYHHFAKPPDSIQALIGQEVIIKNGKCVVNDMEIDKNIMTTFFKPLNTSWDEIFKSDINNDKQIIKNNNKLKETIDREQTSISKDNAIIDDEVGE